MNTNRLGERRCYDREEFRAWLMQRDPNWRFPPGEHPVATFMQFRFLRRSRAWWTDRSLNDRLRNTREKVWRLHSRDVVVCLDGISDV